MFSKMCGERRDARERDQNTKCFRPGSPRMTCYQPSNKVPLNAAPLSDNLHRMRITRKEFRACTICADVTSSRLVTFKMQKVEPNPKEMCERSIQTDLCITKRVGNIKIEQKGMRIIKSEIEIKAHAPCISRNNRAISDFLCWKCCPHFFPYFPIICTESKLPENIQRFHAPTSPAPARQLSTMRKVEAEP